MIVADLSDIFLQTKLTPNMEKAFSFLQHTDLENLPIGRTCIEGDEVYAIISSYATTVLEDTVILEGHQKYIDIQYILSGRETIGWISKSSVPGKKEYNSEKDYWNETMPAKELVLLHVQAGQAALFYPNDAHAPQVTDGEPCNVKKMVIKVAVQNYG